METKELSRFNKLYPWYSGFSADLLFWVAIDSLFLQFVKGLTVSEIVTMTTVSNVVGIVLHIPILKLVERLGNTKSVRIGAVVALISALTLTFGKGFAVMAAGKALREISISFRAMNSVMLKHNLELQNNERDFIKYSTSSNTVYSVTTTLIALVASAMFNLNRYLPMLGCIAFCIACVVMSFSIADYSENGNSDKKIKKKSKMVKFSPIVLTAIISFGLFFSLVTSGQENAKLFIQDEMLKDISENSTALIIGAILFISRVVRVAANLIFYKIYNIIGERVGMLFAVVLTAAFLLLIAGYFVDGFLLLKYGIMSIGYIIILFARDPFKIFIHNLVLSNSSAAEQPKVMMTLELARKLMAAVISISFAAILTVKPMLFIMVLYAIYAVIGVFISVRLYYLTAKTDKLKI